MALLELRLLHKIQLGLLTYELGRLGNSCSFGGF